MISEKLSVSGILNIVFLHIVLLLYSACTVFSKIASNYDFLSVKFCLFFGLNLLGLAVYAVLWQQVLKKFPLVIAYANKSITVIWGILWGNLFFNEKITLNMIIGGLCIILGICVIGADDE